MKIKRYLKFLNEDLKSDVESSLKPENKDLKSEIVEKIIKSLKSEEKQVFDEFVEAYIKDDDKNKIQGLINDADVYEFYLSYMNEIDAILSDINFYDESPSSPELNCFSLYDYIVKGTMRAIRECIMLIKEESLGEKPENKSQTTEE
jgi:hypothetical protein